VKHLILNLIVILFSMSANSKILVLEYRGEDQDESHGKSVESIACQKNLENCYTYFTSLFNPETLKFINNENKNYFSAINMSFALEKPTFKVGLTFKLSNTEYYSEKNNYQNSLKNYNEGVSTLKEMFELNSESLFVSASGNGQTIAGLNTKGVAIDESIELYPSAFSYANLIKVASINLSEINPTNIPNYQLTDYSNFGLEFVEVAAPVEPDYTGHVINGTSFAAPFISRLADEIKSINPKLNPASIKEILMKSCDVKNIDQALIASMDLKDKGKDSEVYQAMFHKKRRIRQELQKKIGDIILVKCGGVVLKEVAIQCAMNSLEDMNIHNSCLEAQQKIRTLSNKDLFKLEKFWDIRGLTANLF
jgi:hypothetical protein